MMDFKKRNKAYRYLLLVVEDTAGKNGYEDTGKNGYAEDITIRTVLHKTSRQDIVVHEYNIEDAFCTQFTILAVLQLSTCLVFAFNKSSSTQFTILAVFLLSTILFAFVKSSSTSSFSSDFQ